MSELVFRACSEIRLGDQDQQDNQLLQQQWDMTFASQKEYARDMVAVSNARLFTILYVLKHATLNLKSINARKLESVW